MKLLAIMFVSLAASTAAATTPASATACSKCVTNDAGKRTCCARGGGWYRTCGIKGDSKFTHTWDEGMQVCQDPAPGQAQMQAMLANQTTAIQRRKTVHQQQDTIISTISVNDAHGSHTVNSRKHVTLSDPTIVISLFLVMPLWYV